MGATSSKVYITDWDKADGGAKHHFETLDRSQPFREHHTLHLTERRSPRDFSVTDENKRVLYTTQAVPGTAFWFDVCKCDEPMVQVRGHPWGTTWDIFCYHHPTFVGQEPTKNANEKDPALYLKARVVLNFKQDGAHVQLFQKDTNGKAIWSKPVLVYDDVNYLQGKGQTHLVGNASLTSFFESMKPGELKLEVAKGCDIALHIILSVIANLVHSNTSPYMVHATEVSSSDHM